MALPRAIPPRSQPGPPTSPLPAPSAPSGPRRRTLPWQQIALVGATAVVAFTLLLLYSALVPRQPQLTPPEVETLAAQVMASATPPPSTAARVYALVQPSVVLITTRQGALSTEDSDEGLGSGVILDEMGDILTSLHVVEGAGDIEVTFADGTKAPATIVNSMPEKDIAVLRLSEPVPLLVPATLGDPGALNVGDEVVVVGNPFGLMHTVTSGVISGLHRSFTPSRTRRSLEDLIQFDAAVNPGNSGGPLLNRDGEVVGIVAALANPTDQSVFIGIGFAVPIDAAANAAGSPPF